MIGFKEKFAKLSTNSTSTETNEVVKAKLYSAIPRYWQTKLGIAEKVGEDALDLCWVEPRIPIAPKAQPQIYNIFGKSDWCDRFIRDYYQTLSESQAVIFAPWLKTGGADKVLKLQIDALKTRYTDMALVLTDGQATIDAVTEGIRVIKYYEDAAAVPEDAALMAFAQALLTGRSKYLHVANSAFGYKLYERYYKRLKNNCRIGANIFCNDRDLYGLPVGYLNKYRTLGGAIDVIYTDNDHTRDLLIREVGVREAKIRPLRIPVSIPNVVPYYQKSLSRKITTVVWASRLDRQKAPGDLIEIAERLPEIQFKVYGDFVLSEAMFSSDIKLRMSSLPNISYMGGFANITELNFTDSIFLYTAHWDGLPNIILEVGSLGVPIVSYPLPGIQSSFAHTEICYSNEFTVPSLLKTLNECISDPELMLHRAEKCREKISRKYVLDSFVKDFIGGVDEQQG